MDMVHLTDTAGRMVAIVKSQIVELREPSGDYPSAKTVVVLASGVQAVRETIAQIESLLK